MRGFRSGYGWLAGRLMARSAFGQASDMVANNDRGIDVDNGGNLIIRNSARENGGSGGPTNYVIAVGNSFAPGANVTGSNNWGIITNANHPWVNLGF